MNSITDHDENLQILKEIKLISSQIKLNSEKLDQINLLNFQNSGQSLLNITIPRQTLTYDTPLLFNPNSINSKKQVLEIQNFNQISLIASNKKLKKALSFNDEFYLSSNSFQKIKRRKDTNLFEETKDKTGFFDNYINVNNLNELTVKKEDLGLRSFKSYFYCS